MYLKLKAKAQKVYRRPLQRKPTRIITRPTIRKETDVLIYRYTVPWSGWSRQRGDYPISLDVKIFQNQKDKMFWSTPMSGYPKGYRYFSGRSLKEVINMINKRSYKISKEKIKAPPPLPPGFSSLSAKAYFDYEDYAGELSGLVIMPYMPAYTKEYRDYMQKKHSFEFGLPQQKRIAEISQSTGRGQKYQYGLPKEIMEESWRLREEVNKAIKNWEDLNPFIGEKFYKKSITQPFMPPQDGYRPDRPGYAPKKTQEFIDWQKKEEAATAPYTKQINDIVTEYQTKNYFEREKYRQDPRYLDLIKQRQVWAIQNPFKGDKFMPSGYKPGIPPGRPRTGKIAILTEQQKLQLEKYREFEKRYRPLYDKFYGKKIQDYYSGKSIYTGGLFELPLSKENQELLKQRMKERKKPLVIPSFNFFLRQRGVRIPVGLSGLDFDTIQFYEENKMAILTNIIGSIVGGIILYTILERRQR